MKRSLRFFAVLAAMFFIAIPSASATPPLDDFSTPIIDQVDALNDEEVQFAIQKVEDATEYRLSVVFVDTFDGMSGAMWATTTAEQSGMNASQDMVFAVATQERKYGSAYPNGTPVARVITDIEDAALPHLGDEEWTEAVVAYADAIIDETKVSTDNNAVAPVAPAVPSEPVDFRGFFNVLKFILLSALGATVLAALAWATKDAFRARAAAAALRTEAKQKTTQASQALINLDENVKQFGMEIDYFSAEFPDVDLKAANEALKASEQSLRTAFASSQALGADSITDEERLQTAKDVLFDVKRAESKMQSHLMTFADLRERAAKVGADVAQATKTLTGVNADLDKAEADIAKVEARYSPKVFAEVRKHLASSRTHAAKVAASLAQADAFITAGQSGRAVSLLDQAVIALDNADDVAAEVAKVLRSLEEAPAQAEVLVAEIQDDLDYLRTRTTHKTSQTTMNAAAFAVQKYRNADFTSGDPLAMLVDLRTQRGEIRTAATVVRQAEKRIADAQRLLPSLTTDTLRDIAAAVVYSNHKDIKRTSRGNLSSLESDLNKAQSITDPVRAVEKVQSIRSRAQEIMSAMKRDVNAEKERLAKIQREKEEEERRARRERTRQQERRNSSYGSSGSTYAYGSYSSSSSSYSSSYSSSSSFGGSGGDFGGGGGSGGDF